MSAENMEPLPVPDAVSGKDWVIEREWDWTTDECEASCDGQGGDCSTPIVAHRRDHRFHACEHHLRSGLMWLEFGVVVSWRLLEPETA